MTPMATSRTNPKRARSAARALSAADRQRSAEPLLERHLRVSWSLCRALRRRTGGPGQTYASQVGEDGSGYTRRFASEYGQLATRNVIHDGLAGLTGLDPRYSPCRCNGRLRRSAHALKMSFTTYRQDGRLTLDVPQIAGAYGSGMISTYWYPHSLYTPLGEGIMFGHEQMGEIMVGNLVREFAPDLRRGLHLHSFAALIRAHPSDDD